MIFPSDSPDGLGRGKNIDNTRHLGGILSVNAALHCGKRFARGVPDQEDEFHFSGIARRDEMREAEADDGEGDGDKQDQVFAAPEGAHDPPDINTVSFPGGCLRLSQEGSGAAIRGFAAHRFHLTGR
jgi:hypothetical protein